MVPSRREWRRNLRCECRAQDSSGCRPGYCGPDVSDAPDAAQTVSRSQLRLGGNVRVVEAAGGIHKQAVKLYSSRERFRPGSHCPLVVAAHPRRRQSGDRRVGPSASISAASTSRVDKPRTNPAMIRPPARWSWYLPNEGLADLEGNLRRCHLHPAETTLECSRQITAVRSDGLTHARTATLTFARIRTTSRRPGMLVHVAQRGRYVHGASPPTRLPEPQPDIGSEGTRGRESP
jgi:hypothetical protein